MKPVLSILIPTFNRAGLLSRLLGEIEDQLDAVSGSEQSVEVLIGNNASEDDTQFVIDAYISRNQLWTGFQHVHNQGADANILHLLNSSHGSFRWIIGDDDLPIPGLLPYLVGMLASQTPSLVYLPSRWLPDISAVDVPPVSNLNVQPLLSLDVSKTVNIWITYISSWIFNADQLLSGLNTMEQIAEGKGTYFIQLGCILPLLVSPKSCILVAKETCIMATSGNTGGYGVLEAFMVNYPMLVNLYTRRSLRIRMALIGRAVRSYLPRLISSVRTSNAYHDSGDSSDVAFKSLKVLWLYPGYWFLCLPLLLLPAKWILNLRSLF